MNENATMPGAHGKRELLRLTNPRVYPLEANMVLVESVEGQVYLNTQTVESRPVDRPEAPGAPSIFEHAGEVLVYDSGVTLIDEYRPFVRVCQIGRAGFFREDYDVLKQARTIWDDASDLDSTDQFASIDSHFVFAGEGLLKAVPILLDLVSLADHDVSELAVSSLTAFFRHAGHGCFSRAELAVLRVAAAELREALGKTNDPDSKALLHDALEAFASAVAAGVCF